MEELKIPKERISMLLGTRGAIKRKIERLTQTRITVNSEMGDVMIDGDSVNCFNCLSIVKAIARGFNPEIALKLLDENFNLEVLSIDSFARSKKDLIRIRARIIGTRGRARENIEEISNTDIEVYGKTVSIIGKVENVMVAKQGITNLLHGSKHGNVYAYIEKQKSKYK
ncbi:RNA-processing protein [Candidatus Woesearchaeota archaeon]|nr:RNA-processing protein [Candidatus Woesearchaeota archaeon]